MRWVGRSFECWAQLFFPFLHRHELPQETQHMIFEKAVVCGHHDERDEDGSSSLSIFTITTLAPTNGKPVKQSSVSALLREIKAALPLS